MSIRYSYGGDEHIFVEISESMSLASFFKSMRMTQALKEQNLEGIDEICPANASFQVKYNPDICSAEKLMVTLKEIENSLSETENRIKTRVIEVPVFYQDPYTHETLMRFRERHQDPEGTDLSYAARINGYDSIDDFILAHSGSPWMVTMVGFVSGLPFLFQMVEQDKQIEVPKYVSPRTDTPKLTLGYGGCFSCIYSVRGAGGYQMLGILPMPIFDPEQKVKYLKDFMVFFKPGDIVKFKPINEATYDRIVEEVEEDKYTPKIVEVEFDLESFTQDMQAYNKELEEALHVNSH